MNYWVFNDEMLTRALAALAERADLSADDVETVRAFLYSEVARELKMRRGENGKTQD